MYQPQTTPNTSAVIPANTGDLPLYLREKQLRSRFLEIGHGTLWGWVKDGLFPPPVRLSAGVTAWRRSDLEAWANGQWQTTTIDQ